MCASGDIFKAKVDKLLSDIEGIKKYINNIIVLGKGGLSQHIDQLRAILARLRDPGLKCNAPKFSFGFK